MARRILAALIGLALCAAPAAAFDWFAAHKVTVHFANPDGKPMVNAEVRVFAPGKPDVPALTGKTDSSGAFEFPANQDGFWIAQAQSGGEIARVMVRVGGAAQKQPMSPAWLLGGLFLLLLLALGYRIARARARRPRP